jgi:hypothetical protein
VILSWGKFALLAEHHSGNVRLVKYIYSIWKNSASRGLSKADKHATALNLKFCKVAIKPPIATLQKTKTPVPQGL